MNRTDSTYQRDVSDFVNREVIYCVSSLVSELAQKAEAFPDYFDDLMDAYRGMPDHEEAARADGWLPVSEFDGDPENEDAEYVNPGSGETSGADDWADLCDQEYIETADYEREAYEHWIVSDWLARHLEAHNERVLRDFFGMTVWCRTVTGQSIAMDHVICEIYDSIYPVAA